MWGERTEVQVSRREFHTYIYLDKVKIEFLSCIKKMHIYIYIYIMNLIQLITKHKKRELKNIHFIL